jgi:hypothetical protein
VIKTRPRDTSEVVASDVLLCGEVVGTAGGVLARTNGDRFDAAVLGTGVDGELDILGWSAADRAANRRFIGGFHRDMLLAPGLLVRPTGVFR